LAAVSEFALYQDIYSYNNRSDKVPNLEDKDQIYRRSKASIHLQKQDGILVCIGEAQFGVDLINALGERIGEHLNATAVTVTMPVQGNPQGEGHAVMLLQTRKYGNLFIDWGKKSATHTLDTEKSLDIFQASQGVPAVYHAITGCSKGCEIGNVYSEDGRVILRQLSYHNELPQPELGRLFNDAADGAAEADARFKEELRKTKQ
jgi:hypothetical protein